jgi:DNA photolyase
LRNRNRVAMRRGVGYGQARAVSLAVAYALPDLAARPEELTAMPSRAVVWFRRDLRVADHPALLAALRPEFARFEFEDDPEGLAAARNRALCRFQEAAARRR